MNKKLISICLPCRNEVDNVEPLSNEIIKTMEQLSDYDFELIFIDNCSDDGTQDIIRKICNNDNRIKAILNAKNFPEGSGMHVLFQAQGDCIIAIPTDFQVPIDNIPKMVNEWEKGATVVALIKNKNKKDKIGLTRRLYYKLSKTFSNQETLAGFTGSGLYDKNFINICKSIKDPLLSMRHMVTHFASPLVKLYYDESPRRSGKSKHSFVSLVNVAIMRFIRVSDMAPRYAIISGIFIGIISFFVSLYYLIRKLIDWEHFPVGTAPLVIGVFFLGAIQLIFIGLIGEYVLMINERQKDKPRVIEKERINFDT